MPIVRGLVSLFLLATTACGSAAVPLRPPTFSFHPGARPNAPIATLAAIEVVTDPQARELEAADVEFVGELGARGGPARPDDIATEAATHGATHYRLVDAHGFGMRAVLLRVDRSRWRRLSDPLRPPSMRGEAEPALASSF